MAMHLLVVPRLKIDVEGLGAVLRPDLGSVFPAIDARRRGWGQASSYGMDVVRGMLVYVNTIDDGELDEILRTPGSRYVGEVGAAKDIARIDVAFALASPQYAEREAKIAEVKAAVLSGDTDGARRLADELVPLTKDVLDYHRAAADEWTLMYRPLAEDEEKREARTIYALTTAAADDCSGTSASIDGRTMVGVGSHVWALAAGGMSVGSGVVVGVTGNHDLAYDATASAVGVQRTTINSIQYYSGAVSRYQDASNFYLVYNHWSGLILYSVDAGSYTQIGSTGTFVGDTPAAIGCDSSNNSQSIYLNGALDVGPVTDANHATGVGGVWSNTSNSSGFISGFDWAIDAGGGGMLNKFAWLGGLGKPISSLTGGLHG